MALSTSVSGDVCKCGASKLLLQQNHGLVIRPRSWERVAAASNNDEMVFVGGNHRIVPGRGENKSRRKKLIRPPDAYDRYAW